jgi:DNA-binding transcriptional LysR family regulator
MLDARRLKLLSEFAERGSIAATAAALGYTPSAVSQQLTLLEREAGAALLDRTARSAELTGAGRRLAARAQQILALMEAAEADLSAHAQEPEGRVVVTAFPTAAVAFAPALAHSLRVHPGLTLLLRETQRGEGLRPVRSGEADVALVDDWSGRRALHQEDRGLLRYYPLFRDPLVLVLPRAHPMATQQRVQLRRLREEAWMVTPAGEPSRQAVDRMFANAGGAPPVSWEFEGLGTILSLVARGIGIAAVPRLALAAGAGQVAVRELPGSAPARVVYAVARTSSVRRPAIAVVLAALRAAAENLPGQAPGSQPAGPAVSLAEEGVLASPNFAQVNTLLMDI